MTTGDIEKKAGLPSIDLIRKRLSYNPETGDMHWLYDETATPEYNSKYPGKIAGYIHLKYRLVAFERQSFQAHNLIWAYVTGDWPALKVDHADLDESNNRWTNLRLATDSQNRANTRKPKNNTSGIKGVSRAPRSSNWRARIGKDGVLINLGVYSTKEEAAAAYEAGAKALFAEFARTE